MIMTSSDSDHDTFVLEQRIGYKQKLYRGIHAFSSFAFGFTGVGILVSISALYGYGLVTGGPVVIFWGFLVAFALTMVASLSFAEICSAYPSAGSVYHWAAQVVPKKHSAFWAYICGWFNFLGNCAGDAAFAYSFAYFLNAAINVSGGDGYNEVMTATVSILVLAVWSLLNLTRIDQIGWINDLAAYVQISSLLLIILALLIVPKELNSTHNVFFEWRNETGFDSTAYVVSIGMLLSLYSFIGYEASGHMAEETHDAATSSPYGIIWTCFATGVGGILYLVALLYASLDYDAINEGPTDVPAMNVILLACGEKWAIGLAWVLVLNMFFSGVSSVAVTGRITYALTRDGAMPYSEFLSTIHPTLQSPVYNILFLFVIDTLILCLAYNPNALVAFFAILSITTVGLQVSYGIPIMLKLLYQPKDFTPGPVSLGIWSPVVEAIASIWLLGTSVILFLPTAYPVTTVNMNWSSAVVALFILIGAINWIFNSRHHFKGPVRVKDRMSTDDVTSAPTEETPLFRQQS